MNNVVLSGRLTRDPELKYLTNNNAVARFNVAVDKNLSREKRQELESKGQQTADFINCQAWGKMAESLVKYSGKGLRVLVNGRIQTGSYEKDGRTVYTTDVVISNVQFIDWKDSNSQNGNNSTFTNTTTVNEQIDYLNDFVPVDDSRIPF